MRNFNLEPNGNAAALAGVVLLLTSTGMLAQSHGGGAGRGPAFSGGETAPGASFHAEGPAVIPPVVFSNSGLGHVSRSYGHVSGSYGTGSYGSSHYHAPSGGHQGDGHYGYKRSVYPFAYYAYPYYVTPAGGWVGEPGMAAGEEAGPVPDQSVYKELDVLHQQMDQLRADQQAIASGQLPPASFAEAPPAPAEKRPPALILVFRDGTRTEVQDYAVVGQTFWDLSTSGTRKIPLAQLDLQASISANDARGVEFPVSQ